ncbi:MAG: hypothetical protein U0350_50260 [Caldilineaceae bacterium]
MTKFRDVEELAELHRTHIVISSGSGTPEKRQRHQQRCDPHFGRTHAGVKARFLGQQCIGLRVWRHAIRAPLMHGKVSPIQHTSVGVFEGLP